MAKDNVVNLGEWKEQRPELVWTCACGGQLFYVIEANPTLCKCRDCSKTVSFDEEDAED